MLSTLVFASSVVLGEYQTCPRAEYAAANIHTMAQMKVSFENSCSEVAAEVSARAQMQDGWTDPHNGGRYTVQSGANSNMITTTRTTGNGEYTDKQTFALTPSGTGCSAEICSSSQGTSANDGGTNLCDMENLFCNSGTTNGENGVSCKPIKTDLKYTIDSEECGNYVLNFYTQHQCQNFATTCLKQESQAELQKALEMAPPPADEHDVVLGEFQTCPRAAYAFANIHTMAQMSVSFKNSCAEVAAEVEARAEMQDGWTDPHNDGKYRVEAASSNLITTTRTTGNGEYTDKQTFALTPSADGGCNAQICSASQGTSANDGGTNLCDMYNLFCNKEEVNPENGVHCVPIKTNLQYTIESEDCGRYVYQNYYQGHQCQAANPTCLRQESKFTALAAPAKKVLSYL